LTLSLFVTLYNQLNQEKTEEVPWRLERGSEAAKSKFFFFFFLNIIVHKCLILTFKIVEL
jgi:hypothetical protein